MEDITSTIGIHLTGRTARDLEFNGHTFVSRGITCVSVRLAMNTTLFFDSREQIDALVSTLRRLADRLEAERLPTEARCPCSGCIGCAELPCGERCERRYSRAEGLMCHRCGGYQRPVEV